MRALLFDIDGTLTRSHGAGTRALGRTISSRPKAARELARMRLDGMTDRAIVRLLLAAESEHTSVSPSLSLSPPPPPPPPDSGPQGPAHANPHDAPGPPLLTAHALAVPEHAIDAVIEQYLAALEAECRNGAYVAMPGVRALLDALHARQDVLLALCTGNLVRGAELKLTSAGLWGPFRFGGYGSDAESRPEMVRVALSRARAHGATEAIVIDDTPRGILAAHEAGVPAIGVATGRWSVEQLKEQGAELAIQSFADLEQALALLLGPLPDHARLA